MQHYDAIVQDMQRGDMATKEDHQENLSEESNSDDGYIESFSDKDNMAYVESYICEPNYINEKMHEMGMVCSEEAASRNKN